MYTVADAPAADPVLNDEMDEDEEEEDEEEEEEEEEEGAESASEDETRDRIARRVTTPEMEDVTRAEPSELMQLELPEDIRVGSPNDGSNNLDSDFHLLAVSQGGNAAGQAESSVRWGPSEEALQVQLPASGKLVVI